MRKVVGIMVPVVGMLLLGFSGCGKNNNLFSFTHSAGSSSDAKALLSDAETALRDKDYDKAKEYFNKLLAADPDNAQAIYGEAAAELAAAGIDIATLVANLVKNNSGSDNASHLAPAIASAARRTSSPGNILPDTIIDNLSEIRAAVEAVLRPDRLPRIVAGQADSSLAPNNPDVNLNLAFCYVLHAALVLNDHVTFDTEYHATVVNGADLNTDANTAANDLVYAYHCMRNVVESLNLSDDGAIASISQDVKDLFIEYKSEINSGPYGVTITASIE
jgi:hypothetical protein